MKKDDGLIDWTKTAEFLERQVRAMNPWPGAFTFLDGKRLNLWGAEARTLENEERPGTVIQGFADELWVGTGQGALNISTLQKMGGKRLKTDAFLRGHPIAPGTLLG